MEKALLILPVFLTLIVGVAVELESIARETSDKAIAFSDDMNSAMDCAIHAIPISECSPELMAYDFTKDAKEFQETLEDIEEQVLNETQDQTED